MSRWRARVLPGLCAVAASAAIAGCGGSGAGNAAQPSAGKPSASTSSAGTSTSPAASGSGKSVAAVKAAAGLIVPGQASKGSGEAVAYIKGTPITKSAYEHWLAVEQASGLSKTAGHEALGFLITSSWVLGEAATRHLNVSEAEVSSRLAALEKRSFPKQGELQSFLKKSGETIGDLRTRVRLELLIGLIKGEVRAKATKGQGSAALSSFERSFKERWKAQTSCKPSYVMEDCKQYKGSGEPALSHPESEKGSSAKAASSSSSGESSSGTGSSGGAASTSGEVQSRPGAFAIGSPAFADNGAVPATYTCDGSGQSPPLQWSNVPKGTAELVLFVIDDSSNTSSGGIRWVVAGIPPTDHSVAAGATPAGAVVGDNGEGKAAYGAICPAKGHTDRIELVMYALKKPISLSPGFQPAVAEHDYGSTKDLLGEAAVSYATYTRP